MQGFGASAASSRRKREEKENEISAFLAFLPKNRVFFVVFRTKNFFFKQLFSQSLPIFPKLAINYVEHWKTHFTGEWDPLSADFSYLGFPKDIGLPRQKHSLTPRRLPLASTQSMQIVIVYPRKRLRPRSDLTLRSLASEREYFSQCRGCVPASGNNSLFGTFNLSQGERPIWFPPMTGCARPCGLSNPNPVLNHYRPSSGTQKTKIKKKWKKVAQTRALKNFYFFRQFIWHAVRKCEGAHNW